MQQHRRLRGAGGTPGGVGPFLLGMVMAIAGGYLLMNQVVVTSSAWYIWGYNTAGLSWLPLLFGVGLLFFNGRSILGWFLLLAGVVIIFMSVLARLDMYFRPTSLFHTLLMLILLVGGIGLVARSLRTHA